MKLKYLESLFYSHGIFCATHPFAVINASIFLIIILSYPAVRLLDHYVSPISQLDINFSGMKQIQTTLPTDIELKLKFWRPFSNIEQQIIADQVQTETYLRAEQILIEGYSNPTNFPTGVLDKQLLLQVFNFQKEIENFLASLDNEKSDSEKKNYYTIKDLCVKIEKNCLVYSPFNFWNSNEQLFSQDENILSTISKESHEDIPIPLISS